jgi:hypothetical protein
MRTRGTLRRNLRSNFGATTPKHLVRPGTKRDQKTKPGITIDNPVRSAKPPSQLKVGCFYAGGASTTPGLSRAPLASDHGLLNEELTSADLLYLFCTCTGAFCRFLPIEPIAFSKSFENLTIVADRLPPPPPKSFNEDGPSGPPFPPPPLFLHGHAARVGPCSQ